MSREKKGRDEKRKEKKRKEGTFSLSILRSFLLFHFSFLFFLTCLSTFLLLPLPPLTPNIPLPPLLILLCPRFYSPPLNSSLVHAQGAFANIRASPCATKSFTIVSIFPVLTLILTIESVF